MKIQSYVYFTKPGERAKLKELAHISSNEFDFKLKVQETFGLDIVDSNTVVQKFYKILKDEK
jgi:hypothetical protein